MNVVRSPYDMTFGYMGKILHVNLSKQTSWVEDIPEDLLRQYIGGSGLGARILYENTTRQTNPISPDNLLIFMCGPFTGTRIPLSGRHEVTAKSPATGGFGEADVGGTWGQELKKTGFDGLVIWGRAVKPTYVWLTDNDVELRDASAYWGMDTYTLDEALRKETDLKARVASIGPAGERLAKIAGVMHDGKDARPAARGGLGAVMGSKNLKAIIVRGTKQASLHDAERLARSIRELAPMIIENTRALGEYGTSNIVLTVEQLGDLPIKNWVQGRFEEGAQRISGQTLKKTILKARYYCGACIVGCGREVKLAEGCWAPVEGAGPEYETVAALGALCLIDNLPALAKAHELCNRYGLDLISTGSAIAFAMEAFERRLITERDTDGVKLTWGDPEALVTMVERIGKREGFGWLLGEGVLKAAERIGKGAEEFALHVKGLELPMHDPRAYNSLAVGYATSNRGACHLQGFSYVFERSITFPELGYDTIQDRFGVEGKGELVAKMQNLMSVMDSLKLCKFTLLGGVKGRHILEWVNAVTGWNMTFSELMQCGERIFNLKRMYNIRCGFTRREDTLPQRILTHKRKQGGAAENLPPFEALLQQYYDYRDWDAQGKPRGRKLSELGINRVHHKDNA